MKNQEVTKRLLVKRSDLRLHEQCSVIAALKVFATKWKPCILCYLAEKPLRYNELYRVIPNISRKMLSAHLKEMELDQLIIRSQYDAKLQRVEYTLSEKGKSLLPILTDLQDWGMSNLKNVVTMKEMIDNTLMKAS